MRLFNTLAVLAAALGQLAVARLKFGEEVCLTKFGTSSVAHVQTQTSRTTIALTLTLSRTSTLTTTLRPTLVITTSTTSTGTTTLPQITDTFTVTTTVTTSPTVSATTVDTVTVTGTTTTTIGTAVTVSLAAGFTPYASLAAVIAAGGGTSDQTGSTQKRHEHSRYSRQGIDLFKRDGVKFCPPGKPKQYPQSVSCYVFVESLVFTTTTITAQRTKTKRAHTVTSTTTLVIPTTVTVVPSDASVTVTNSVTDTTTITSTVSSTTSTTSTTTLTSATPTSTFYPMCQNNNLIDYVGGTSLYYLQTTDTVQLVSTPDALTCCELCAVTTNCAGFSGPVNGFSDCYLFISGTCDPSQSSWTAYAGNVGNGDISVVGNSNCGQGTFGGAL